MAELRVNKVRPVPIQPSSSPPHSHGDVSPSLLVPSQPLRSTSRGGRGGGSDGAPDYEYRYLVPITTFLTTFMFAANGWLKWGWVLGAVIGYFTNAVFLLYVLVTRDPLMANFVVFGLWTGFGTLVSDCYQVVHGILIYPQEGPFWGCSPQYMFWCSVPYMVQMAFLAYFFHVHLRLSLPFTCALNGVLGAALIGTVEFQAKEAQGWSYTEVPMVYQHLPWYIVLLQIPLCGSVPLAMKAMLTYTDSTRISLRNLLVASACGIVQSVGFPVFSIAAIHCVEAVSASIER